MEKEFTLVDPGEGIHEAEIIEVLVSEGDQVEEEDSVLVIETDKATTEVPSPMTGVLKEIKVSEGDMVKVGDVLMIFEVEGEAGEAEAEAEAEGEVEKKAETEEEEGTEAEAAEAEAEGEEKAAEKEEAEEEPEEEKAEKKKEEKEEAEKPEEEKKKKPKPEEEKKEAERAKAAEDQKEKAPEKEEKKKKPEKMPDEEKPVPAAPSTRRVARELGVNLHDVEPSGPGGRVTTEDVKAFAEGGEEGPEEKPEKKPPEEKKEKPPEMKKEKKPAPALPEAPELPDFSQWGEVKRVPLRSVRRTTAKRMRLSWSQIPHVTHEDVADITDLEAFRQKHKEEIEEEGGALTLTIFAIKAAVAALKAHPRFNASLDMDQEEIILKHYYHIGAAVDTDRGLLVPVIRDADRKSVTELAKEFPALAEKTRKGEADRKEMIGGTFTITNVGPLGGTGFTPIINYPQVAILGMAKARLQPVVLGDMDNYRVKPRLMLPLALGFDHRIVDGADAARFMGEIIAALENPEKLMMLT